MKDHICVRLTFGLLNGFIWVLGCGVVAAAIWLHFTYGGYISLLPQHEILSLDGVILVGGVALFLTAFLGCCGAWCKSQCLLITYFLLVAVLCAAEITCGVLGFLFSETISFTLKEELLIGVKNHYNISAGDSGMTLAWDVIQQKFNCCGITNYDDWFNINAWPNETLVPHSCCIPSFQHMEDCGIRNEISMWYPTGCYEQVELWFQQRLHFVGIAGFVLAVIQLFGLTSSMILCCAVRQRAGLKTYKAEVSPPLL